MKTTLLSLQRLAVIALLAAQSANAQTQLAANNTANRATPIPMDQLGAVAGKQYQGEGLSVSATPEGARLRCVFQRLEGEATFEGLWLTSTVPDQPKDRFRLTAVAVGREGRAGSPLPAVGGASVPANRLVGSLAPPRDGRAHGVTRPTTELPPTGDVLVDGQTVRVIRPGLVEEYSVSMDGVRQDFVVLEKPPLTPSLSPSDGERVADRPGEGELRLELAVSGAQVEPLVNGARPVRYPAGGTAAQQEDLLSHGARLVLEGSGRKIAYSRLRVTDATGKELSARMEVAGRAGSSLPAAADSGIATGAHAAARLTLAVLVNDTYAVYPIRIDPTFSDANWISMNPSIPGADGNVYAAVVDGSGNLYIGGGFTAVGEGVANYIAKWNGSSWTALGSGMNSNVYALAVSDGDLYAGGYFTTAGGVSATNIAKWDGSTWCGLGSGMSGGNVYTHPSVQALAVSGSDLYGIFTNAGGVLSTNIGQWNGSGWSALGWGMNSYGYVFALAVSGTNLYAGGDFTTAGWSSAYRIAKWNGSSWSPLGSGMNDSVYALAVSGSDLYAGGEFTTAGGVAAWNIAEWNGSNWSALGVGMDERQPFSAVYALAVSGTNLFAANWVTTSYVAKWDGSSWSALSSEMDGGSFTFPSALAVSGANLYAGGWFSSLGGPYAHRVAKWNGSSWSALGSGMNGYGLFALAVAGTNLYAGGIFTTAGTAWATNVAKWNGSTWSALGAGLNDCVRALAVSGSDLYAGGDFTTAGGVAANCIAKWNGSSWSGLGSGMGGGNGYPHVYALALSGSDLYAGGRFTTAGGVAAGYVAKWDGSSWSALDSGLNGMVEALAVSGTNLYAGGWFTTAGGIPAKRIARWNGSSWSPLGSGMNGWVYALAVSSSDLYAGGDFTTAGGRVSAYVARAVLGDAPGYNQLAGTLSSGGAIQFSYVGDPATNYALDRAFDLAPLVRWVGQQTNTMTVSGVLTFTNMPVSGTNNFWRVRSVP